jgi:biopolymer transport protein ExbD
MAGISVGSGGDTSGRRPVNSELPLIPFIDFLLCLVAFLLVTAVWSQMARLGAHAQVPGDKSAPPPGNPEPRVLHVGESNRSFWLVWREGSTVYRRIDVEKKPVPLGQAGEVQYPALAQALTTEWQNYGTHRAASDPKLDLAVVHTSNGTPFSELAAVLDALHAPARDLVLAPGQQVRAPAFNVAFAVD